MLHWMRWRQRVSGTIWLDSVEVKSASLRHREGGGWEECMEMGGASTGGMANVNLKKKKKKSSKFSTLASALELHSRSGISLPVNDVTEHVQSVVDALDGLLHGVTLEPQVAVVGPL